jgi:alpha-1,6-mannosyltransferase
MRRTGGPFGPGGWFWLSAVLLVAASGAALVCLREWRLYEFVALFFVAAGIYGLAAWCLLTGRFNNPSRERATLLAILAVAGLLRAVALFAPQALSTDAFRYVWDGRVEAAGINPYRYVPSDPALAALRDRSVYPNINRAGYAHTIYPPTAQLAFWAITRVGDSILGMKIGMLAFDAVTIVGLLGLLRAQGLPSARVLLYAWHPLPVWEFAGTGHVDAVAIALVILAFVAASRRAPLWTGAALAAATLVKYYPVVMAPALYRRWDWRMPVAFVCVSILLYLPFIGAGTSVLGFLSGYAGEEGLRDGSGIFLWSLLPLFLHLPADALRYYAPVVALVMLGLSLWVQFGRGSASRRPMAGPLLLAGIFTLLVSPHDPWYFTWIIPFVCFRVSLAHLWLTIACVLMYVLPDPSGVRVQALLYVPFLLLLVFQYLIERRLDSPEKIDANRAQQPSRA